MRKIVFIIWAITILAFFSCSQKEAKEENKVIDTISVMVMQIQKCSRLYTAEAQVHKIITHDDQLSLKGSLLNKSFNIQLPASNRKIAIPMDATIKAYIDFKDFSQKSIIRKGDNINIILPDPYLELTSSKIDHQGIKQYVSLTRSNFSDAELSQLEQKGREGIIKDIPKMNLLYVAQENAANILIPMLKDMGFKEENIKITFRKKFTFNDLKTFLTDSNIEKK